MTNYEKFIGECMYSENLKESRAERNLWLPALEDAVSRLSASILERIMEGVTVWILDGIPSTLDLARHKCHIILLPEGDWSFEARVGIIAHEFAHTIDGLETCWTEKDCDDLATEWGFGKEVEYYCLIQGNLNPQWCPKEALDQFQYPMHCDDGKWHRVEDDGSITDREGCLAYSPRAVDAIPYGDALVTKHRTFMHCLAEAANLHYAIEDAHSGKAQAKLDELLRRLNTGDFSDYRLY